MTLTENEIRPTDLMAEQAIRYAADVKKLLKHKEKFVHVTCPACEADKSHFVFSKYEISFVECSSCQTVYANPRPNQEQMDEYYAQSENYAYWNKYIFPASENARREKIFKPRVAMVLEICKRFSLPANLLVEVGSGFGTFCEEMVKTKAFRRIIAIEPTPDLAKSCRDRGLTVIESPIERVTPDDLTNNIEKVDVIVSFEVIEHLFNPRSFILKCASLLSEGGVFILTCPNSNGFDIRVLKELSPAVDTEHVNLFNLDSLAYLLESCGFELIDRQTPGQLDVELVRNKILSGEFDTKNQSFIRQVVLECGESVSERFQQFLIENRLSSNMLVAARKK